MNEAIILLMFSLLHVVLCGALIACAFLLGRHYAIIKRSKLPDTPAFKYDDIVSDIKETARPTPPRIISPSKRSASSLVDMEKDVI